MTPSESGKNLPPHYNCLETIYSTTHAMLTDGVKQRNAPFHTPTLGYIDQQCPMTRSVVLRGFCSNSAVLRFHTHVKSPKIAALRQHTTATLHFYDAEQKIQIICAGQSSVSTNGDDVEQAWDKLPPFSRRCYMLDTAPGTPWPNASAGFAEHDIAPDRVPTQLESERGRVNFAVVSLKIAHIDWLYLSFMGNRRAQFTLNAQGALQHQTWLLP